MKAENGTEIDAGTLRSWLDNGQPVEVIDIRPQPDYDAWHIPGSRNVDAYQALHANSPGPLAAYTASGDRPVVAVCFVGQTSQIATQLLRQRGIPALSLAGGMQAWSLAWNTAEVPLKKSNARVLQVRRTGKGCLSYLVGSEGEALAIDPSVEPQPYLDLAAEHGWRIANVLDTHIHADHLSRSRSLAELTGAAHLLPRQERATFDYQGVEDGDLIGIGAAQLQAIATPGHTFESMSFLLDDEVLFSGDTLFLDSVGRPDLKADRAETEARARALHRTLQELMALDAQILVLPGHASQPVPFDRAPIAAPLKAVVGKVEALGRDEETFVNWIWERLPPHPPNYELIVGFNEAGISPPIDPTQLEAGANRCAV
jgi:glyoxylase-like metal-dependent hydrolase (beta-lactamase superfamily II)